MLGLIHLWAMVVEMQDWSGLQNPTSGRIGIELDQTGAGTDNNHTRFGINLVVNRHCTGVGVPQASCTGPDPAMHAYSALWFTGDTGATWDNIMSFTDVSIGIGLNFNNIVAVNTADIVIPDLSTGNHYIFWQNAAGANPYGGGGTAMYEKSSAWFLDNHDNTSINFRGGTKTIANWLTLNSSGAIENTALAVGSGISGTGLNGQAINAFQTATPASYATPGFNFNDQGVSFSSFGDTNTHVAMVVTGNALGGTTGSYEGINVTQYGTGRDVGSYVTGGQFNAIGVYSTDGPNYGIFTGINPVVRIPANMTAVGVWAEEDDLFLSSNPVQKFGIRIADLSPTATSACTDTHNCAVIRALKTSTAAGWQVGLDFTSDYAGGIYSDTGFPIVSGGTLIRGITSGLELTAGIDFSRMVGGFSEAAIVLCPNCNGNGIFWGSSGAGGQIVSYTTTNGMKINFANGYTGFEYGAVNALTVSSDATIQLRPVAIGSLPRCNRSNVGKQAFINNGIAAPTYHQTVSTTGSAYWPVFCTYNGSSYNWVY